MVLSQRTAPPANLVQAVPSYYSKCVGLSVRKGSTLTQLQENAQYVRHSSTVLPVLTMPAQSQLTALAVSMDTTGRAATTHVTPLVRQDNTPIAGTTAAIPVTQPVPPVTDRPATHACLAFQVFIYSPTLLVGTV